MITRPWVEKTLHEDNWSIETFKVSMDIVLREEIDCDTRNCFVSIVKIFYCELKNKYNLFMKNF